MRRVLRAGATRHRLSTVVVALVVLAATAMVVLGAGLLTAANAPFDRSFAAQRGAHAAVVYDSTLATDTQLRATASRPGVTAAAGPFALASVEFAFAADEHLRLPPARVAGRGDPEGPVDALSIYSGRWVTGLGEIVLSLDFAGPGMAIGEQIVSADTTLTVVGLATSITHTADGWVSPGQVAELLGDAPPSAQMLYRFDSAGDPAALASSVEAVTAELPDDAILGTGSYLTVRQANDQSAAAATPFVIAFAVLGMVVSVLIVANVVGGAVLAGYRHIGILKAVGFTPAQVVGVYAGRMLLPSLLGGVLGLVVGNLLALPILNQTALAYDVAVVTVPLWANLVAIIALAGIVGAAAVGPALRAGRLPANQALALGRAPRTDRGAAIRRLLARTGLPRPVGLGLGTPVARPARSAGALVAIGLGAITLVLATGLSTSLTRVADAANRASAAPVRVELGQGRGGPPSGPGRGAPNSTMEAAAAQVEAVLRGTPGVAHVSGVAEEEASVVGLAGSVPVTGYAGDSSWTGYQLISGRWFTGPDEAVVPSNLLTTTGKRVGDTLSLRLGDQERMLRITGEIFEVSNAGLHVITDAAVVTALNPDAAVRGFEVGLLPGTDADRFVSTVNGSLTNAVAFHESGLDDTITLFLALIGTLVLLVTAVAAIGVFNTTLLNTREQVRDIGILKAVGMTPRQVGVMVVSALAAVGLVAGIVAVPLGVLLHGQVLRSMAAAAATNLPDSFTSVYSSVGLILLALAGVGLAVLGALIPAGWAARSRPAVALRAE